jgi:hypothetical protein
MVRLVPERSQPGGPGLSRQRLAGLPLSGMCATPAAATRMAQGARPVSPDRRTRPARLRHPLATYRESRQSPDDTGRLVSPRDAQHGTAGRLDCELQPPQRRRDGADRHGTAARSAACTAHRQAGGRLVERSAPHVLRLPLISLSRADLAGLTLSLIADRVLTTLVTTDWPVPSQVSVAWWTLLWPTSWHIWLPTAPSVWMTRCRQTWPGSPRSGIRRRGVLFHHVAVPAEESTPASSSIQWMLAVMSPSSPLANSTLESCAAAAVTGMGTRSDSASRKISPKSLCIS